jgi:Flp pilus assembly protein TadG
LAEFALVLPLLLILLFGIIEFGIAFNRAQAVEAAAREGARLASLSSSDYDDVAARVEAALDGIPHEAADLAVNWSPAGCAGNQGDPVTVDVSLAHTINIPIVLANHPITLTGQAVFRCEA